MAATLTGTPTAITWASGANPAGQSITIPADCTAVYVGWAYYNGTAGNGLSSLTLAGASPSETFEVATAAGDQAAAGVAAFYNPPTGSQTLDPAWDAAPSEGATCIVAYVKDGATTAARDIDAANETGSTACAVTLTTASGDLVLFWDQRYNAGSSAPGTPAGFTSAQTHGNNSEGMRLSYISATGSTQACDSQDDQYSTAVAVSIPAGGGGGGTILLQMINYHGG